MDYNIAPLSITLDLQGCVFSFLAEDIHMKVNVDTIKWHFDNRFLFCMR